MGKGLKIFEALNEMYNARRMNLDVKRNLDEELVLSALHGDV